MKLGDFEDPVLNERCNKGPVYLNRHLLKNFVNFCKEQEKDPQTVAENRGDLEEVTRLEQELDERQNLLADAYVEYEIKSEIPERLKRKKVKEE